MKIVDCSHTITPEIPLWPGTKPFECNHVYTHDDVGVVVDRFDLSASTGTHIDAPYHFIRNGITVDQIPAAQLIASLCVITPRDVHQDFELTALHVHEWEKEYGEIPIGSHVFINFRWYKRWSTAAFSNADEKGILHWPWIGDDAVDLFVERKVKLVGVDTFSPDKPTTTTYSVHKKLLGKNIIILETLTNLDELPLIGATSFVAPLKVKNAAESPVRVFVTF